MNLKRFLSSEALSRFLPLGIAFLLGFWLVVVRPLGPHLSQLPGDLGDGRFNNYVLEHFYRWISGLEPDFWNAPFFAPYPDTIAFSDNLLGSAPLYALVRGLGLDRESAFQGWYLLSYVLNYAAAAFVLTRMKFKPWSAALGAFFFTFGLPVLAQENHAQLAYRFGIPLACYSLWKFFQQPRLKALAGAAFWTVWQLYLSIYLGILLGMLLAAMLVLLLFFYPAQRRWGVFWSLPDRLREAWHAAKIRERIGAPVLGAASAMTAVLLMQPYFHATRIYGFFRGWDEVALTLPHWQSYLLADNSLIWQWVTKQGSFLEAYMTDFPLRHEHQLFPGFALLILLFAGLFLWRRVEPAHRRTALAALAAVAVLMIVTFLWDDFSLYRYVWKLPGMKSLRSVTRVQLVLMFPLSVYMAAVLNALEKRPFFSMRWGNAALIFIAALLIGESALYTHSTVSKVDAQARLADLRAQLPASVPDDPVLMLVSDPSEPAYMSELDGMLLAQDLGWKTMNGYSGNIPEGFRNPESCAQIPAQIQNYMKFAGITDSAYYLNMIRRVVPLGFNDCDSDWWVQAP